jgi:CelD/BcsL family acetyltransferase involved in cellulose biosynthesis
VKIDIVTADAIGRTSLMQRWSEFQRADDRLASPFFCPQYTRLVATVRDDVEVAVMTDAGRVVGFLPYQRSRRDIAGPVGRPLTDLQGAIVAPGVAWRPSDLLSECGLRAWHFDHAPLAQEELQRYCIVRWDSPYMDLRGGFEAYRRARRAAGSRELESTLRKCRKVEREVGPVRFEAHLPERDLFRTLIRWKRQQCHRTRAIDFLAANWCVSLLDRAMQAQGPEFSGMLSVAFVANRPVAIHLGVRYAGVLHWWIPAYDPNFAGRSPGLLLLVLIAQHAESLGIHRIELGKGEERYKASFKSGSVEIGEGWIDSRPMSRMIHRWRILAREGLRASPLRPQARAIIGNVRALARRYPTLLGRGSG